MSLITINVDGKDIEVEENSLLLQEFINHNIDVPHFCYHEALGADGNCRMCMIDVEGQKRTQIACDTFAKEGMVINTKSDRVNKIRQDILELELINHPVDCPVCDQAGECKLQDYYMDYGLYESNIEKSQKVNHKKHVDLGSNVMLDQERCVLCIRCVKFTKNITKTNELAVINRADDACISTMPGKKLDNPYAMNVVDLCPVGALTSKNFRFNQRVWLLKSTPSVCFGCSKGCNIHVDHNREKYKNDEVYRFRPRVNNDVNGHFMCDEGRLSFSTNQTNRAHDILYSNGVQDNEYAKIYFNGMIEECEGKIAILVSPSLYLEELELIKELAIKINANIFCPEMSYIDEEYADDFLKTKYKCSNIDGIKKLDISTENLSNDFELIINFNHLDFEKVNAKKTISFQTHNNFKADLILPITTYLENNGTVISKDGITQYCQKAVEPIGSTNTIKQWLENLR